MGKNELTIYNAQVLRDVRDGRLEVPSEEELEEWFVWDVCYAACDCGAEVEPDGRCEHGRPSWLAALGIY